MGDNFSKSTDHDNGISCSFTQYEGFDDDKNMNCFDINWIIQPGVGSDQIENPQVKQGYLDMINMLKPFHISNVEEEAWWFLRWSSFGWEETVDDIEARLMFIRKYYKNKYFNGFMVYNDAVDIASQNSGTVITVMDNTVPGNIIMILYGENGENLTSMKNINKDWDPKKESLNKMIQKFKNLEQGSKIEQGSKNKQGSKNEKI